MRVEMGRSHINGYDTGRKQAELLRGGRGGDPDRSQETGHVQLKDYVWSPYEIVI